MARRKVIWHIGPADPGTEFLATALQAARPELAEHGVAVPSGAWHEIEDQIWAHKGVSLLSTPGIARADQAKVALRLAGLRDLEVHLVLLVRDLPTQVYSAWQAGLQQGSTTSLTRYADRLLDPVRSHWQAEEFWVGHDLDRILPLWTRAFHADRVHVVAAPRDADGLWSALTSFAGVTDVARPEGYVPPALAADLDAERVLDITTRWAKLVADRGFDAHGSLITASAEAVVPSGAEQWEALAELLAATTGEVERLRAEVARLRAENADLDRKRRKHKRRLAELTAGD
ncbi:hypothetical protein [Marmoricola sp. RAF53]|uniref:hypothetical protein n=1 Tax=Marmoricola sp. RAF53 TaxID=3233059 RepID=UPI003F9E7A61